VQLLVARTRIDAERVEVGMEMAAHAIGPDQHQGTDRVARRLQDLGLREFGSLDLRLGLDLVADRLLDLAPIAVEGRDEFAVHRLGPARPFPGCAPRILDDGLRIVLEGPEEGLPLGIDRGGILLVAGVEVFDIGGVRAVQEGRVVQVLVGVLTCHESRSLHHGRARWLAVATPMRPCRDRAEHGVVIP
jgi:hypothetical protein